MVAYQVKVYQMNDLVTKGLGTGCGRGDGIADGCGFGDGNGCSSGMEETQDTEDGNLSGYIDGNCFGRKFT